MQNGSGKGAAAVLRCWRKAHIKAFYGFIDIV
jgi:hypothetical protein